jgi:hypothetical protein
VKLHSSILVLLALLAVSCASDSGAEKKTQANFKPFSQRLAEDQQMRGKDTFKADSSGNFLPQQDKRSSFESKNPSGYYQGEYGKKAYKTGEYAKKSWWGNKQYGREQYAGNTDGSRFQKDSRFGGKGARESGSAAKLPGAYQTDNYATSAAREADNERLSKPSNAEIENRREGFQQPEIIGWQEQRKLSMDQSRGILGR